MRDRAFRFGDLTALLMTVAAAAGLARSGLYRDNLLVASGWRGNDLITIAVAVPMLVIAARAARRGSATASLVWLGLLDYALYNYAFYLFGAAFNALFLVYVAIVIASASAIVCGLVALDVDVFSELPRRTARAIALWLCFIAVGLGGVHVGMAIHATLTGTVPAIVTATAHPTNVVAALDLTMVVFIAAVAARLLWTGRPWGVVLAMMTLVKGAVYMLALSAATFAAVRAGAAADLSQNWLWGSLGAGCAIAAWRASSRIST